MHEIVVFEIYMMKLIYSSIENVAHVSYDVRKYVLYIRYSAYDIKAQYVI